MHPVFLPPPVPPCGSSRTGSCSPSLLPLKTSAVPSWAAVLHERRRPFRRLGLLRATAAQTQGERPGPPRRDRPSSPAAGGPVHMTRVRRRNFLVGLKRAEQ